MVDGCDPGGHELDWGLQIEEAGGANDHAVFAGERDATFLVEGARRWASGISRRPRKQRTSNTRGGERGGRYFSQKDTAGRQWSPPRAEKDYYVYRD
ncbi:MAG: hypothetical protein WBX02_08460 [Terriglobales bacterium]